MEKNNSILFVDDDPNIINALRRSFRKLPYKTFYALSGKEGLSILEKEKIDIVISDMRMPEMDGYEFLSIVREKYPNIPTLVLSGFTDKEIVYKSLLKGIAKAYISKPWDKDTIVGYIERILHMKALFESKELMDIISSISMLPTLSKHYQKIISLIEQEADIKDIAELIEQDPSLTANLLKLANSVFYGRRILTGSVKEAIIYLGEQVVKDLVFSLGAIESMTQNTNQQALDSLWECAQTCNRLFHLTYKELINQKVPDEIHSVGLLFNIGLLFFYAYFPKKCQEIEDLLKTGATETRVEAENQVFGLSHDIVGGYLLDWWNLPYAMVESAMYHHRLTQTNLSSLPHIPLLHIIEVYAYRKVKGWCWFKLDPIAFELVGISQKDFEQLINQLESGESQ